MPDHINSLNFKYYNLLYLFSQLIQWTYLLYFFRQLYGFMYSSGKQKAECRMQKSECSPSLCCFQQLAVTSGAGFANCEDKNCPWFLKAESGWSVICLYPVSLSLLPLSFRLYPLLSSFIFNLLSPLHFILLFQFETTMKLTIPHSRPAMASRA
jgi:hypothetical protein